MHQHHVAEQAPSEPVDEGFEAYYRGYEKRKLQWAADIAADREREARRLERNLYGRKRPSK